MNKLRPFYIDRGPCEGFGSKNGFSEVFEKQELTLNVLADFSKYLLFIVFVLGVSACENPSAFEENNEVLAFDSSNKKLVKAFNWAKDKALSYAHDGSDPVGPWYEAALPNREAFCMRDVSHQSIGAEILGLSDHNYNMILRFAENISEEKDYCTYWEINRYNKAAPVDYENDKDFWYNLPANFDVIYSAYRLYQWTGNKDYLENQTLLNFYALSLNEYVDHWDLGAEEVVNRNRSLHLTGNYNTSRFQKNRGIPTYNEGGRGETILGIDMTASLIAAYKAYSEILTLRGEVEKSEAYKKKAELEQAFLKEFWWDDEKEAYRSILYDDGTFDYFMVGHNQAFLHYLFYFDVLSEEEELMDLVSKYDANFYQLIVELKSYLPIMFYENGYSEKADEMILSLCNEKNERRDYPENSFTVIEHFTRGLMGLNVDATTNSFSSLSRIAKEEDWAELNNIPVLSNTVSLKHYGTSKTIATNVSGGQIEWEAKMHGIHGVLFVNGRKVRCKPNRNAKYPYSSFSMKLNEGEEVSVSVVRK